MIDVVALLSAAVVFLFDGPIAIGTGFIVGVPMGDTGGQLCPVVVTAKHVVGDRTAIQVRFSGKQNSAPVTIPYDLAALRNSGDLWVHDDPGVDIVAFRTRNYNATAFSTIGLDLIASKEVIVEQGIHATDRVIFPGLLLGLLGESKNCPVVRDGSIALMADETIPFKYKCGSTEIETRQQLLLVDSRSTPGVSGSPVFLWPGPRMVNGSLHVGSTPPLLLGVMHGYVFAPTQEVQAGDQPVTANNKASGQPIPVTYRETSGIAIAFPAWRLGEILRSKRVTDRISELWKAESMPPPR